MGWETAVYMISLALTARSWDEKTYDFMRIEL